MESKHYPEHSKFIILFIQVFSSIIKKKFYDYSIEILFYFLKNFGIEIDLTH